jgi:regulator of replication initiation timing
VRLQVLRQTQALKESLGLSDSQAAQLSREVAQLRTALAETQAAADTNQQQVGCRQTLSTLFADMLCYVMTVDTIRAL